MDIEFVGEQSAPDSEPEDVLSAGRPRRVPRAVTTAVLALVVGAGGVAWVSTQSADRPPRPVAAPSTSARPAPVRIREDVLAGCPNTLACDATHQMQQHQIDMIRQAMLQHRLSLAHKQPHEQHVSWVAGVVAGGTMAR